MAKFNCFSLNSRPNPALRTGVPERPSGLDWLVSAYRVTEHLIFAPFENQARGGSEIHYAHWTRTTNSWRRISSRAWACIVGLRRLNSSIANDETDSSCFRDPAGKPIRHSGAIGDVFRDGDGDRAPYLSVAEK